MIPKREKDMIKYMKSTKNLLWNLFEIIWHKYVVKERRKRIFWDFRREPIFPPRLGWDPARQCFFKAESQRFRFREDMFFSYILDIHASCLFILWKKRCFKCGHCQRDSHCWPWQKVMFYSAVTRGSRAMLQFSLQCCWNWHKLCSKPVCSGGSSGEEKRRGDAVLVRSAFCDWNYSFCFVSIWCCSIMCDHNRVEPCHFPKAYFCPKGKSSVRSPFRFH